ncbi:MAG: 50S ribosomal protein L15 [Candidatus Geothermincolia bacterium]
MGLHDLKPADGSRKDPKRIGRGRASGHGKTSGRGSKGQKARGKVRQGFEGGQMPLQRRVPKLRGFKPLERREFELVNLDRLNDFGDGDAVNPETLAARGMVKKADREIKILGRGELERKLSVSAHAFSATAREKIEAAGGSVEVI